MNLVGKIFTVLIFLMCVIFGTFALMVHAAHKNWKEVVISFNNDLTKANQEKQLLTEEKKNLQTALDDEKERTKRRIIALEQAAKDAVAQKDLNEQKLQLEEGKVRVLALAMNEVHKRLAVLQTSIDGMRTDIKVATDQRDSTQKVLVTTNDRLLNEINERDRLQKLQRELADQITKAREALEYFKIRLGEDFKAKEAPFGLEGQITAVPRPDVLEISVGADSGVRKGHQFVVTRPSTGKYIGVIQVIQADWPDRAVCQPDKSRQLDQFQKGDHVKANTKSR
jgi:hypothetical protein